MKYFIIGLAALLIIGGGVYFYQKNNVVVENPEANLEPEKIAPEVTEPQPEATPEEQTVRQEDMVIGSSVEGNDIHAYHFGDGEKEILFIGGVHGGYSWNTSLVAFDLIDYLKANPSSIPNGVSVTVIPVLNPDGLESVVGSAGRFDASKVKADETKRIAGRFNANGVDLNRNFDCKWQPESTWQTKTVSGGEMAFSEPEAQAIENIVTQYKPTAVVVWYSAAGGVYSSNCEKGVLSETNVLTNLFAKASGYGAHEEFNYYEITGDMVNWFASQNIPAISVLLTNHTDPEWTKNQAGVMAIINHYAQ